jgi:LCP family protein required for cell wall assembly
MPECSLYSCSLSLGAAAIFVLLLAAYLFFPSRTSILVLGVDYTQPWSWVGRSDTIILTQIAPWERRITLLSIPRDLWVTIPGYGDNRINTAHFFAEGEQVGSGPLKTIETIQQNFGTKPKYYLRVRFEGFKDVVNAMGGLDINLPEEMAGYPPGRHHLSGNKALAFARHRLGSDDFFRMEHGQFLVKAAFKQILLPWKWPRLPAVILALLRSVDTNIPSWQLPRLALSALLAGPNRIETHIIEREMVTPFTTDQGASVLLPNWESINALLADLFVR